jgi:hypothetical protein
LRVHEQLFQPAPKTLLIDVTGNTLTTTSTQSSTEYSRNMKEEVLQTTGSSSSSTQLFPQTQHNTGRRRYKGKSAFFLQKLFHHSPKNQLYSS